MKKFLLGCALAVMSLSPSVASADYCCPVQNDCCSNCGFEGIYIGGNIGVFSHIASHNDLDGFLDTNSGGNSNDTNFLAGLQLGYDWQCNETLVGLVVDWNWINTDHNLRGVKSDLDWFTTIRARAGLTVCNTLLYLTGGAAVRRSNVEWDNGVDSFKPHDTIWGWTGGFGAEFKVWCNWSIGAEFLCLHFDDKSRTFTASTGDSYTFSHSDTAFLGRVVLNYRFGDLFCCW